MPELLKLVYDYSKHGKNIDTDFIYKIVEMVVKEKKLEKYVQDVMFEETTIQPEIERVTLAAYRPLDNAIRVDPEAVQYLIENGDRYSGMFEGFEQRMYNNFMIAQIVLHELEHAYQAKLFDNKQDQSDEAKIVRASLILQKMLKMPELYESISSGKISEKDLIAYIEYKKKLYYKYYDLTPTERLAQINSHLMIANSLMPIKQGLPNLYEFEYATAVHEMLQAYHETLFNGICPTYIYLHENDQDTIWRDLSFYDDNPKVLYKKVKETHNLSKRLALGLPIEYDEYESVNNMLHNTNRYDY